jgi:hypothetical protein
MDNDISAALHSLVADSGRCAAPPATTIRRRGDRRRTAVRVGATGGTIALVGATAGTAFAVAGQPAHHPGRVKIGIAGQSTSTPSPVPTLLRQKCPSCHGVPTPTPIPSTADSAETPTAVPTLVPIGSGHRGTAQPIPSPTSAGAAATGSQPTPVPSYPGWSPTAQPTPTSS